MMESTFIDGMMEGPVWVIAWVGWMMMVNSACVFFLKNKEARIVLATWIVVGISMMALAEFNGYNRLLGLVHVAGWTPLMIYLATRREHIDFAKTYGRWIIALMLTNTASLVIDYIDVFRYIMGDRA